MTIYRTRDGDMIDQVCKGVYGTEAMVTAVLEANPHLADLGPVYGAGIIITLPDVTAPAETSAIRLWGRT